MYRRLSKAAEARLSNRSILIKRLGQKPTALLKRSVDINRLGYQALRRLDNLRYIFLRRSKC